MGEGKGGGGGGGKEVGSFSSFTLSQPVRLYQGDGGGGGGGGQSRLRQLVRAARTNWQIFRIPTPCPSFDELRCTAGGTKTHSEYIND